MRTSATPKTRAELAMIHLPVVSEQSLCVEARPSHSQIFVQQCEFMYHIATFTRTVKEAGCVGRRGLLILPQL